MSETGNGDAAPESDNRLRYMPALDGVRAVSILGIMANHGGFAWAAGGIISVNVFFVLSGFLITMLLMKEWARSGTIRLRHFWARRARRLLPALFVLLAAIGLYIIYFAPSGSQSALRGDGLSTLLYFSNWHQIFTGQSYFAQVAAGSAPSPLLHTWTLAIEEQFYLVWPILAVVILKVSRSRWVLLAVAVAGTLASAIEMAVLFHPHMDPSRVYWGTDTRAQDLLTGAVLGILLFRQPKVTSERARIACSSMVAVAVLVFGFEWASINTFPDLPYRGGFLLADVMVALVIAGVTLAPTGVMARILSFGPLTFVGRISYGLYLWHWPIFLVLDNARTGLVGWNLFVLRLAATFTVAVLSWYLVETPVRKMTFTSWRTWSWIPAGAVAVPAILFITTATSGAATAATTGTNIFLSPAAVKVSLNRYENAAFPTQGHQRRVLVVGDSLSLTVGFWLSPYASRYGLVMRGRPLDGCGLATAVPYDLHGTPTYPLAPCAQWPSIWHAEVSTLHPQVVVLVIGWWDAMDRMYQGKWQHLGDPAFDAYEKHQIEEAVSVLHSGGAPVAITTSPFYDTGEQPDGQPWDEDAPGRVDRLNTMIESVAALHPGIVSVVPLNRYLDPDGHFTAKIGGKTMRFADGVHTTEDAGTYLAPKILPQLAALQKAR
jgi:peptidoglycan/LPS O-acetylase OafA/YrhL